MFKFNSDSDGVFGVRPAIGCIPAGAFQLLCLRFSPQRVGMHQEVLVCSLNSEEHSQEVTLMGLGAIPTLLCKKGKGQLEEISSIMPPGCRIGQPSLRNKIQHKVSCRSSSPPPVYLKPTCAGVTTKRTVELKSGTRIPLVYMVELPDHTDGVLSVHPLAGTIMGNEKTTLTISFDPRTAGEHDWTIPIKTRAISGPAPAANIIRDARQLRPTSRAQVTQTSSLRVKGLCLSGVVEFDPEKLDFGCLLVKTSEARPLALINHFDCDVKFTICYRTSKSKEVVSACNSWLSEHVKPSKRQTILRRVASNPCCFREIPSSAQQCTSDIPLFATESSGILAAKSKSVFEVTFCPSISGEKEITLLLRVSGTDSTPNQVSFPWHEVPWYEGRAHESAVGSTCQLLGRASFPTVVVQDARLEAPAGFQGNTTRYLWESLSLSRINAMLATPLTTGEIKYNLESSPDPRFLQRFPVHFIPSAIGSGRQVIVLQISNPGFLPTSINIQFPNKKDIEMETWASEGEPTEAELQLNDIIDRLRLFEVTPQKMSLQPGESINLRISYSFTSLQYQGEHDLPLLVQVDRGKQFFLDLKGITLTPGEAHFYIPTGPSQSYSLHPVALGTSPTQAPLQIMELMNVGGSPISFSVDTSAIEQFNKIEGYGESILRLEDSQGQIPAKGVAELEWWFYPLEARDYTLTLSVTYSSEDVPAETEAMVTILLCGYDPRLRDPHSEPVPAISRGAVPPPHQLASVTWQPATLSEECLRLKRLVQGVVASRVVVLRNSTNTPLQFDWNDSELPSNSLIKRGLVSIEPMNGVMDPNGRVLIKVSVNASCPPCIISQAVVVGLRQILADPDVEQAKQTRSRLEQSMKKSNTAGIGPHLSVVSKTTASRTINMDSTWVPEGRESHYPCTLAPGTRSMMSTSAEPAQHGQGSVASTRGRGGEGPGAANERSTHSSHFKTTDLADSGSATQLHIQLIGEVAEEESCMALFSKWMPSISSEVLPKPRAFIPYREADKSNSRRVGTRKQMAAAADDPSFVQVAKSLLGNSMREVVAQTEIVQAFQKLPDEPRVPGDAELLPEVPLVDRLVKAMATIDLSGNRAVSATELTAALISAGITHEVRKGTNRVKAIAKAPLAALPYIIDDIAVTQPVMRLRDVLRRLDNRTIHALEGWLKGWETRNREDEAEKEALALLPEEELQHQEAAALAIQKRARMRAAKAKVEQERFIHTEEGREQNAAAVSLQSNARRMKALKEADAHWHRRVNGEAATALHDDQCLKMVYNVLEGVMCNISDHMIYGEMDAHSKPQQMVFSRKDAALQPSSR
ncbi:unnamed protein product [Chrysoparadoxa australica]